MELFNANEFDILGEKVRNCDLCPRMCYSQKILNRSSGSLNAEIMFIGEAPGRLGADNSGIPFHGDKAGHNFEELLKFAGIHRSNIFVTNAVLCNPRDEKGNNSTPTKAEIDNCSFYLREQIKLINPKIIVTLGSVALESTKYILKHDLNLRDSVRTANRWYEKILIPFYHPGQRAMIHRSMANQRSDYQFLADIAKKLFKKNNNSFVSTPSIDVISIINYLYQKKSTYTYFALHKLFYLIEYRSVIKFGARLTNSYIIRQKDGPYCTDLHILKIKKALPYLESKILSNTNIQIYKANNVLFEYETFSECLLLQDSVKHLIDEILVEHGDKTNAALKRTVYFSRPMRNILSIENEKKLNLYNTPISFDNL
ncbi:MAG TPA: uracil-DNA glycosylase family protein [Mucilaginibacter sp.]|jgi:uracil-DNA glycosylase family 4|nr:uracil-DNA glycosylase family protein [Mucilaginibacter sp.]